MIQLKRTEVPVTIPVGRYGEREVRVPVFLDHNLREKLSDGELADGSVIFFSTYTTTRHYGGREEGGWWYDHNSLEASIPWRFSREHAAELIDLFVSSQEDELPHLVWGDLNSVNGGQAAFFCVELRAGDNETKTRPHYD